MLAAFAIKILPEFYVQCNDLRQFLNRLAAAGYWALVLQKKEFTGTRSDKG
jgi:hypothetical protein